MGLSPAPRELILVAKPEIGLRATNERLSSLSGSSLYSLTELLRLEGAWIQPLFGLSEDLLEHRASLTGGRSESAVPGVSLFYKVSAEDSALERLAGRLREEASVQAAFIKPGVELPVFLDDSAPPDDAAPTLTPNYFDRQSYLGPAATGGIDAMAAWKVPGGDGRGIEIMDVEGAWRFTHEDLKENLGGLAGGTETSLLFWRNHGTAVLGMLGADRNQPKNVGVTGICPGSNLRGVSVFGQPTSHFPKDIGTAAAIRQAADLLDAGDIMLIEMQAPGPVSGFNVMNDDFGYIPVEWWPDNLTAIKYAIDQDVIVVAAAANGAGNLNDAIYDKPPAFPFGPFPADWTNPLRRDGGTAFSILVGAGAPPLGTNHTNHGPDRCRRNFSNYGLMIDAQGWGSDVTTSGYGVIQKGNDEDRWYTSGFGGTSSASAMVAAALACVQGALKAAGRPLLKQEAARQLLRLTGSVQTDGPAGPATERIGNRPNIKQMLASVLA